MNNNDQRFVAQKIREQYLEREGTELDTLRALDAKVRRPASLFAYIFGAFSALIMGTGMSLVMSDIAEKIGVVADTMLPGIIIGIIGIFMALINYPVYKKILCTRKNRYKAEIMEISEKIIGEE